MTNDRENLMLLCPGCHDRVDRDGDNYPEDDLSGLHSACLTRIRLAASTPRGGARHTGYRSKPASSDSGCNTGAGPSYRHVCGRTDGTVPSGYGCVP
ncbi:hypothetical protein PSK37_29770 [Escherichia coli]|nr:hypothetical protein [Escherichia coli]